MNISIRPPYLKAGDKIGIVSPAKSISATQLKAAVKVLQRWGFEPVFGRHIFSKYHQFAGTDAQRLEDMQEFIDDNSIKAILASRGGYGSHRIVDHLNYNNLVQNPKWIIGFSDITVFHCHLFQNFQLETLHATMPLNFPDDFSENENLRTLKQALFGELNNYHLQNISVERKGEADGILVGGNLSIIVSLLGTKSELETKDKILLLEDVGENLYRIDRLVYQLKRAGKLNHLKALIIGGFANMEDNEIGFGKTSEEIIIDAVSEYNYPIIKHFPVGHQQNNLAVYLGRMIKLSAKQDEVDINFL